jgi:hypothetical protein
MKTSEFRKLIREEIRKVLKEGLDTVNVEVNGIYADYSRSKSMPYSDFLSLIQTNKIKKEVSIALYDFVAKQPLTGAVFNAMQKDLFALGYKWIDGTQEIHRTSGDGNRTIVNINPIKKQLDIERI